MIKFKCLKLLAIGLFLPLAVACTSNPSSSYDDSDNSNNSDSSITNGTENGDTSSPVDTSSPSDTNTPPGNDSDNDDTSTKDSEYVPGGDENYPEVAVLPLNIIDNFEDGDSSIISTCGRQGAWYTYNDGSSGGTQTPSGDFAPVSGGDGGSSYCGKYTGSGFIDYGSALATSLRNKSDQCNPEESGQVYDASVFTGIVFDAIGNVPLRVNLATDAVVSTEHGGICASGCDDAHGRTVYLQSETQWRQYKVLFEDAKQEGWGTTKTFDPSKIMNIVFNVAEGENYNFSIDNLAFIGPDGVTNESAYPDDVSNDGPSDRTIMAGFRSSEYGLGGSYLTTSESKQVADDMASYYSNSRPTIIWIVGQSMNNGTCKLNFPGSGTNITSGGADTNEAYLDYFDANGIDVILQVEPNNGDITDLIDTTLTRYKHHSSVVGFGIDAEFYTNVYNGKAVTDAEATAWLGTVQYYDSSYILMLKHFDPYNLPPCVRDDILFINDTQGDTEANILNEYAIWADYFAPGDVGFQIGYETDQSWWTDYPTPPDTLGDKLIAAHKNTAAIFWVDFTLDWVFNYITL